MDIKGKQIKCVSNFQAPDLVVGKVYTVGEVRTNPNGIRQVEVGGKWYAHNRFVLAKKNEGVKQQFYVGDKVKRVNVFDEMYGGVHGEVYEVTDIRQYDGCNDLVLGGLSVRSACYYTIVERAWQENTGQQTVEDDVEVEVKLRCTGEDKCLAGEFRWDFEDCSGDIVEWRLADSVQSTEEQPEDSVPPSHVAVGEELVATDESEEQKKKHPHYFKKCGYEYVDVYRVLKMFDVTDPCISHAAKKLLVSGGRGFKDIEHDIQDVIDTLVRWQEMRKEDEDAQS